MPYHPKMTPTADVVRTYRASHPIPYKPNSNYLKELVQLAASLAAVNASDEEFFDLEPPSTKTFVYVYLDTRKPGRYKFILPSGKLVQFGHRPFYVGKGVRRRMLGHLTEAAKPEIKNYKVGTIRAIWRAGLEPKIVVTSSRVSDNLAKALEIDLIAGLGLARDGGCLTNLSLGGEGPVGFIPTKEQRARMSAAGKGRPKTPEHNRKNSEANRGRPKTGKHAKGHRKTAEECRKNSEAQQRNNAIRNALPDIECDVCGKTGRLLLNHFTNCRGPKFKSVDDPRMRPENRNKLPSVRCPHCDTECRGPKFIEHFGNCSHK